MLFVLCAVSAILFMILCSLFFNDAAPTEIYTRSLVGSVRCVYEPADLEAASREQRRPAVEVAGGFALGKLGITAAPTPVSYTHLRAHETVLDLVCRLLLEKKKNYLA